MSNFVPSQQQKTILDWVGSGNGNSNIEAVAGAGKTTTLVQMCRVIPETSSIVFLAYNKKIADEIGAKVVKAGLRNVKAATFHSVGYAAWRRVYPRVKVDAYGKNKEIANRVGIPYDLQGFVFALLSHAKNQAIGLFGSFDDLSIYHEIVERHNLAESLENPEDLSRAIEYTIDALYCSNQMASAVIDFDDMLYCPLVAGTEIETYDWVLVDECQDLNPARRAFSKRLMHAESRAVFVGDSRQAIYGFTGADSDSVAKIVSEFGCVSLPLTTTYRCPKSVVAAAQAYVSHIQAHETAPEGVVRNLDNIETLISSEGLKASDAILCRNTKPLVELAYTLIKRGIACHVEGRDIGAGLEKLAKKYKVKSIDAMKTRLEAWVDKESAKLIAKGKETAAESLRDRYETLLVIADGCDSVEQLVGKIKSIFADSEGEKVPTLTLSTVHKAKGREWNRVYLYGQDRFMPSKYARQEWQKIQETNLIYVAYTRAMSELIFIPYAG